jgi:superfamily II RNA helicase
LTVHLHTKRVFVLKLKQTVVLNSSNTEVKSLSTPFFSRQAILGRQVGGKILEELSKVPSYTIQTTLEDSLSNPRVLLVIDGKSQQDECRALFQVTFA